MKSKSEYIASAPANWRNYVAHVRADAIEITSPEIAEYMAENPGQFATLEEAIDTYRHDVCFLCPILGHWFPFEDGIETRDGWVHVDALTIGMNDAHFDYGPADEIHAEYECGDFPMAAE